MIVYHHVGDGKWTESFVRATTALNLQHPSSIIKSLSFEQKQINWFGRKWRRKEGGRAEEKEGREGRRKKKGKEEGRERKKRRHKVRRREEGKRDGERGKLKDGGEEEKASYWNFQRKSHILLPGCPQTIYLFSHNVRFVYQKYLCHICHILSSILVPPKDAWAWTDYYCFTQVTTETREWFKMNIFLLVKLVMFTKHKSSWHYLQHTVYFIESAWGYKLPHKLYLFKIIIRPLALKKYASSQILRNPATNHDKLL